MSKIKNLGLLLALCISASAQGQLGTLFKSNQERGDEYFNEFAYQQAIEEYKVAMKKAPSANLVVKIAESYRKLNDPANASIWYAQVVEGEVGDPAIYLHYADALSNLERYEEAKTWYAKYKAVSGEGERPNEKLQAIENLSRYPDRSAEIVTRRVNFNSDAADFSPEFYENDQIVFVSSRASGDTKSEEYKWDNTEYLNLFVTGDEKTVKLFHPEINTKYHEGPLSIYAKNTRMIFTRNNFQNGLLGANKDGVTKLKLYTSTRKPDGGWSKPQEFKYNSSEYSIGHPAVTEDGKLLVFVSDMPGGFGGTDLYKSEWVNDQWSEPVNMGEKVNTKGNELFPYLTDDYHLYFASDGHGGFGGLDIFGADLSKGEQASITNLGKPFNSSFDDFSLIIDGDKGYFSSNREKGKNNDEIYAFESKKPLIPTYEIRIVVKDNTTSEPVSDVSLSLVDTTGRTIAQSATDGNGEHIFTTEWQGQYVVQMDKADYHRDSVAVDLKNDDPSSVYSISLKQITPEPGMAAKTEIVKTIYYKFNESRINSDSRIGLAELIEILKTNNEVTIEIEAHTDSRGSNQFNQRLSETRFRDIVKYLTAQGIAADRIKGGGKGETALVNECADGVTCTEDQHKANRRAEIIVK